MKAGKSVAARNSIALFKKKGLHQQRENMFSSKSRGRMALKSILSPKVKVRLRSELSSKWQSVEQWQHDLACLSNELDIERYMTNVMQITLMNVYIDCNRGINPNKKIF